MKNLLLALTFVMASCSRLDLSPGSSPGSGNIVDNLNNDSPFSPQYVPYNCSIFGDHDIFIEVDQDWYATSIPDENIGKPITLRLSNIRTTGPVSFTRWFKQETGEIVYLGTFIIEDSTCCQSTFFSIYPGVYDNIIEVGMMIEGPEEGNDYDFDWSVTH